MEVASVVNVLVLHGDASILRVKVSRIHEHSSHILLFNMYHQNTANIAHFTEHKDPRAILTLMMNHHQNLKSMQTL
jgi:hypothetical protein